MLHQLSTRTKLLGFSALALAITGMASAAGYIGIVRISAGLEQVANVEFAGLAELGRMEIGHQLAMRAANALQIERSSQDVRDRSYARITQAVEELQDAHRIFGALPKTAQESELAAKVDPILLDWTAALDGMVSLARDRDRLVAGGAPADGDAVRAANEAAYRQWQATAKVERDLTPAITKLVEANAAAVERSKLAAAQAAEQTCSSPRSSAARAS
jgi:hypothetical protein